MLGIKKALIAGLLFCLSLTSQATTLTFGTVDPGSGGVIDARVYGVVGDNSTDNYTALTNAIAACETAQGTLQLPTGSIRWTGNLQVGTNCQIAGTKGAGHTFDTALRPVGSGSSIECSAAQEFQWSLRSLMIWPVDTGTDPAHVLKIDNCYRAIIEDVRIFASTGFNPSDALVVLTAAGGASNYVRFKDVVIEPTDQVSIAVRIASDAGSYVFDSVDVEQAGIVFDIEGGHVSITNPYIERCGQYCINVDNSADADASLSLNGGIIKQNNSSVGIALQNGAHDITESGTTVIPFDSNDYPVYGYDGTGYAGQEVIISYPGKTCAQIGGTTTGITFLGTCS